MKFKVKINLKNSDNIFVQLTEEINSFPMGLNYVLGIFKTETHPNIDDFLADGFEICNIIFRRIK